MSRPMSLHFQAVGDLVRRYLAVFQQAWRERRRFDPRMRLSHETQFLPAALALQETPVSPAPRMAMWLLMAFALIALVWSIFGKFDVVATAQGKVVPNGRTKVIQPIETATVRAIYVTDGQEVKAGDVLLELDATATGADVARTSNDLIAAKLQAARASALLAGIAGGKRPTLERAAEVDTARLAQEQRALDGQNAELQAKLAQIDAAITKHEAELQSTREIVTKLEQTAPIARQRAMDFKDLVDKNFVSKHGYLEREQVRIEQEADLATQRSRLKEIDAVLLEARRQKIGLVAETRRTALDTLNEAEQKSVALAQELIKAQMRNRLMTIAAPVDGTVQQLAAHTVGGIVTPAQPLMMIVPRDNQIEVEAFVENKDIGFVNPGQAAEIKVETFQFTKYGTIHATVTHISNDAINDEKRGLIYSGRFKLSRATMHVEDKIINLSPGMAVTVEIKTAKRRVIEYFLSPLIQHTSESLRER